VRGQLLHVLAALVAARRRSWPLALATAASLELEASGRTAWTKPLGPLGEGANVVGRIPADGRRERTLVLVAHHDTARTGLVWEPRHRRLGAKRRLARRAMEPEMALLFAAVALAPTRVTRPLLWLAALLLLDVDRHRAVPGASDNASGVAAVLALAAEPAPPGTEVFVALVGSEESGMDGMRAFLAAHAFDPATTVVLGLDTLGAGTPLVARAEGAILPHAYRPEDLALVPDEVERWRIPAWTDPVLARFAGLPALSLLSRDADGRYARYHVPEDLPEHVDTESVEACLEVARRTVATWAADRR
jgi:hypothetical protein